MFVGEIKTVGVKELKNKLSAYLREVRAGTRVLVSDRNRVIAELREPGTRYGAMENIDPALATWIEARVVRMPTRPKEPLAESPVHLPEGTAREILDRDRGDRGE